MNSSQRIYVAGHRGMVGSAVVRRLNHLGCSDILTRTRDELDLCDQAAVRKFFHTEQPDAVIFAAARVGGIHANSTYPAEFIYQNLAMATHAVHEAWAAGTSRLSWGAFRCP